MRRISRLFIVGMLALAASCTSYKDIVYLQDIETADTSDIYTDYEPKIKVDDRLTIIVSGPDKQVTAPYNLTLSDMARSSGGYSTNPEQSTLSYLVDQDGNITFPKLGIVHVEGMTRRELTDYLTAEIGKDVKNPIVYITIKNYKVTIIGEVRSAGTFLIDSEKMTIFQALGKAGDLNLTAKRDGVIVLRDEDGVQKHYIVDLRSSDIFKSPAYYVQQNDVIIVQPSPTRVATATTATGIWSVILSSVTTLIAVISMITR